MSSTAGVLLMILGIFLVIVGAFGFILTQPIIWIFFIPLPNPLFVFRPLAWAVLIMGGVSVVVSILLLLRGASEAGD